MINKNQKRSQKSKPERPFSNPRKPQINLERTIKFLSEKTKEVPHNVDAEVSSELNEELVHLTEVSGIPMGIKKRKSGKRVFPKRGDDPIAGLGIKQMNVHIPIGGDAGEGEPSIVPSENVIRRRVRREEGKFRSNTAGYISHQGEESVNWEMKLAMVQA